jgi:hypothetical protein
MAKSQRPVVMDKLSSSVPHPSCKTDDLLGFGVRS